VVDISGVLLGLGEGNRKEQMMRWNEVNKRGKKGPDAI
jgi:hypothetical protein